MAESTTGVASVEQGSPPSESSLEGILEQAFAQNPPTPVKREQVAPEPAEEEVPEQEASADDGSEELSPDDLPDDENAPQSADAGEFEIVHNGQQHKLSREETIKLAQQGFDYTQKTQAVAEKSKAIEAELQRATAFSQMMPMLATDLAQVKAIEGQLQQYANVDWVKLADEDFSEYPRHRARYDQLMQAYQVANGQFQQKVQSFEQERNHFTATKLQQERVKLVERVPAWADPAKYQAESSKLANYLVKQGADPNEVASLSDSLAVSIARKAMLYDELVNSKRDKSKQLRSAPPVVRPGAAPQADKGKANFAKVSQAIRKAGQRGDHLTQQRLAEELFGRTFK